MGPARAGGAAGSRAGARVELRGVSFGYDPARLVLHDIDLCAEPGQSVALVGHTGGGKSSIINLVAKFHLPTRIPRGLQVADVLDAMRTNKRFLVEGTRMALVSAPGRLWSVDGDYAIPVSEAVLGRAIRETMEA